VSVRVRVQAHGPLRLEGEIELTGSDGASIALDGAKRILLCRCGASENAPFCDGSHHRVGFRDPPRGEPGEGT
jgi:CDGSH-type Zn-finger protein